MKNEKVIRILFCLLVLSIAAAAVFAVLYVKEKKKNDIDLLWDGEAVDPDTVAADGYYKDEYMEEAIDNAVHTVRGPVGAVITKKNGELVVSTCNHNSDTDGLEHAEIHAIREAQKILQTRDLSDCILYTSAEPCLMCACAIANVKISKVYYAADFHDEEPYGLSDEDYYNKILNGETLTEWVHVNKENRLEPFEARIKGKFTGSENTMNDTFHINHANDVYGSADYLDTGVLIAGDRMPGEQRFTVADLEKLASGNKDLFYSGYYSQMSSGGAFQYHLFSGLRVYEFLKYCGIPDDCPEDTPVKFVSVDGFAHELRWGEIKNSTDNVYEKKDDSTPKYANVPKILAFSSDGVPLVGPVGTTELGHVFTREDGFEETANNIGGPVRLVFGQKDPGHSNAPRNVQWVRQIIVGEDDTAEIHEQQLLKEQELRSNDKVTVDDTKGQWDHFTGPYSSHLSDELKVYGPAVKGEKVYTLSEIEKLSEYTVTDSFGASNGVNAYRGIRLRDIINENLKDPSARPSRITILSDDGYEAELNVDDVANGIESRYQSGQRRDVIIAYAVNGKPLVHGKNDAGFEGENGSGPLQLIAENQISKWVEHVAAIRVE